MAMIKKMSISGIRSYAPSENQKKAVIEFQTPLTLIVGNNGTGKTTIIESLNYVVGNNLPPGAKNNAFIHDPKILNEKEVKGQVKLKFTDALGNIIVGTRSMTSTVKPTKIETKQLEGVIHKYPPGGGEPQSISSRCTDFTKEMISRLGVSKAVIENVIFCHQEDSNWPLSEGKVLKQKFDAIFAATRYIKALESIRNLRKEQGQDIKGYNTELTYLESNKDKAQQISTELDKAEAQVLASNEQITKINNDMQPVQEKGTSQDVNVKNQLQLQELDQVSSDVFHLENQIVKLKTTKDEKMKSVQTLKSKIDNPFQGSKEELIELARNSEEALEAKQRDMNNLDVMINRLSVEIRTHTERKTELDKQHGKLQLEAEKFDVPQEKGTSQDVNVKNQNHDMLIKRRDELINQLADQYNLEGFHGKQFTVDEAKGFANEIRALYRKSVDDGKEKREEFNQELTNIEKQIKEYEKSLHTSTGVIENKEKLMRENERKLKDISSRLSQLVISENKLKSLESDVNRAKIDLNEFKTDFNPSKTQDEISRLTDERGDEERILKDLREEEGKMVQHSKTQTTLEMLRRQKAEKEDNVDYILRRHKESLDKVFPTLPEKDELKSRLSDYMNKKQSELRKVTADLQVVSKELAGKETKMKMVIEEQHKTEREISSSQQRLHEVCQDNDYNEMREDIISAVKKSQGALVELDAFEKIYQKYITDLKSETVSHSGCPLCHKKFKTPKEIKQLVDELTDKLKGVPEKREEFTESLQLNESINEKIMKLAPTKSRFDTLSAEMPKVTEKVKSISKLIEEQKNTLKKLEQAKTALDKEDKIARLLEADVSKIDDHVYDLKELDRQLNLESNKLQGVNSTRTMQSIRSEVEERQNKMTSLHRKIDQKKDQLMENQRQLSLREREVNELQAQKLKLESELQERLQLQNQQAELSSTNQAYKRDIRDAQGRLDPIRESLQEAEEEKKDIQKKKDSNEEQTRNKLEKIKSNGSKVMDKNTAIENYISQGKGTAIKDNESSIRRYETLLRSKNDEREQKKLDKNNITEEVTRQEIHKRELTDNLELIKYQGEIKKIDTQIEKLKEELYKFGNYKELSTQRDSLQEKLDRYHKDKASITGRLDGFKAEVKRCQDELASSLYANAETKHCEKLIELRTTELASADLDKYYKALDCAIMKYHGLKLREINKIIKEYWIKTYKGNDIDTIEIVAEGDEDGASKARRSYNYRVCMRKNGISLDMRGRCSAGQKVLASIIIRLALAETFCLNCGILALDEPTTNLDINNIRSLAHALRGIIEMRMTQKNFQLVVITHDEDFLTDLGQGEYVEYFYRIYKDESGYSKIHRCKIEDKE